MNEHRAFFSKSQNLIAQIGRARVCVLWTCQINFPSYQSFHLTKFGKFQSSLSMFSHLLMVYKTHTLVGKDKQQRVLVK